VTDLGPGETSADESVDDLVGAHEGDTEHRREFVDPHTAVLFVRFGEQFQCAALLRSQSSSHPPKSRSGPLARWNGI
jgi:hypothetical protein